MSVNVGILDRSLRLLLAVLLWAWGDDWARGGWFFGSQALVSALAWWLLLTGVFRFCPLYALLRLGSAASAASDDGCSLRHRF
jgi:hypothetical protein